MKLRSVNRYSGFLIPVGICWGRKLRLLRKNTVLIWVQVIALELQTGLDALRLIMKAYIEMGCMKEGDEIIVPANTYIASILSITDNRLVPVLVEPDITTYNIDPFKIEEKITSKTKAIMIVHLYGQNAMHPEIERLVRKYDLKLVRIMLRRTDVCTRTANRINRGRCRT